MKKFDKSLVVNRWDTMSDYFIPSHLLAKKLISLTKKKAFTIKRNVVVLPLEHP